MKPNANHFCRFQKTCKTLDILYPPHLKFSKIKRKFRELFLISEENARRCFTPLGTAGYIFEKERQLTQHSLVIHPYSKFCQYWELIVMVVIFFSLMIRPFFVSQFAWKAFMKPKYQIMGLCADLIDMVDVGLRFIIGYIDADTGSVVLELRKIFFYNVKRFFFYVTVIVSFPVEFSVYLFALVKGPPHSIFLFGVFLKILKLITFERYLRHIAKIYNWSELSSRFVWISLTMVLFYQWLSSFFYLAVLNEEFRKTDENKFIYTKEAFCRHLIVMYFLSNSIFYEAGLYSRISITHVIDMLVSFATLVLVCFSTVYFLALALQLLGLSNTSRIQYAEMIQEVRKFLSQENLPKHVHVKVEKYFQFRFQKKYFREKVILESLSPTLRREIAIFLCMNLLVNPESIFDGISNDLADVLCQEMTFEVFLPGDIIIRAGRTAKKMYFIYTGSVAVYSPNGTELMHLYDGQQFGESTFLQNSYVVTVIALEMSECYVLRYSDFVKCCAIYPDFGNVVVSSASKRRKFIKGLYSNRSFSNTNLPS